MRLKFTLTSSLWLSSAPLHSRAVLLAQYSSVTHYCEATCELKDKLGDLSLPIYAKLLNDRSQREYKRENFCISLLTFINVAGLMSKYFM